MHRSGTSALTGMLQRLGVHGPKTVMPANEHNPQGYGESAAFAGFHERLLDATGRRWDTWGRISPHWFETPEAAQFADECRSLLVQEFGDSSLFVVKDPRMCRLVPFWLRVLDSENITAAAIIVLRSPAEVARSLEARDGISREQALLMWLRHVLDAELGTRRIVRSVVRYRDLLGDWKAVANRLRTELGVTWPDQSDAVQQEISGFLRPDLCHHSVEPGATDVASPLAEWVMRTHEAVEVLVGTEERRTREACRTLEEVRDEFDRAASVFEPIVEAGRSLARDFEEQRDALRDLSASLNRFESERDALQKHASTLAEHVTHLEQHVSNLEGHAASVRQYVSKLMQEVSDLTQRVSDLTRQVVDLGSQNTAVSHELAGARHHVEALLQSLSWRITAPLRAVGRVFRRSPNAHSSRERRG
jgi:hypothetical protein